MTVPQAAFRTPVGSHSTVKINQMYLVYVVRATGMIDCSSVSLPDETPLSVLRSIYDTVGVAAACTEVTRDSVLATHDAFRENHPVDRLSPDAVYVMSIAVDTAETTGREG